jgi:hypothetical protein
MKTKEAKIINKQNLRIKDLLEKNPTIWEIIWVFLWRAMALGLLVYFIICFFVCLVTNCAGKMHNIFIYFSN